MDYEILSMAGSCRNGFERDSGRRFHAVPKDDYRAVCRAEPGRRSVGWSTSPGDKVTCPRCLARLEKQAAAAPSDA